MHLCSEGQFAQRTFDPTDEVIPGVVWGRPEWHLSASYWAALARNWEADDALFGRSSSLDHEVFFCLLGGYGITAEMNLAAFQTLCSEGAFELAACSEEHIEEVLSHPLEVGGRLQKYRFPKQRAKRLVLAARRLSAEPPPSDADSLRHYLLEFDGIGPKTAAWIVRNWLDSDEVAIIDIHVQRACLKIGVFFPHHCVSRHYGEMECRFIEFARAIDVRPSHLDALMWTTMRRLPPSVSMQ